MPAPASLKILVETFRAHRDHYTSASYNEAQLRTEFLDPLFEALGWDMHNKQGYANAYKEVIHEDAIKIGGSTHAPDYCFRVGGTRKFFLEAKKPSVNIKRDEASAYQLRRYAWSAKLPLSILCDFEEFAIYDTRIKPAVNDAAAVARTFYCTFEEYEEKWSEIEAVFARESILKGSFDKYADGTRRKRGTTEVDDAFLLEIERWREMLAKNFALRNAGLSVYDLNFAVQKTIDRIVFLRICEDRGTEDYGRLRAILDQPHTYARLCELFGEADDRYNSGLFHFQKGKRSDPNSDGLTLGLSLDDKVVKDLLRHLYYPESPYEFSVLPADILGQVYERFLGKTITLDRAHRAAIDEKPEVRKAGGVYYTPSYIVDLIADKTLGLLLNGRSGTKPIPVTKAAEIRVLDPACGSGSFLIVAYQYLLDWHLAQYTKSVSTHARGKDPKIYQNRGGEYRLTTSERKRILLNNIFGVDIDPQAVEVTKLSLLLKVLEGETEQVIQRDWLKERQRILPDLDHNIRCGNSLIETDIFEQDQIVEISEDETFRINAFDWRANFPQVFEQGGFDCVIGNPPYIFTRELITEFERNYYSRRYLLSWEKHNTYLLFIEKMLSLLSKGGIGGYIVPNSWLTIESAKLLREVITKKLEMVIDFNYVVFRGVGMEPTVFTLSPGKTAAAVSCARVTQQSELRNLEMIKIDSKGWVQEGRILINQDSEAIRILSLLKASAQPLGDLFEVRTGLQAYETGKGTPAQTADDVKDHVFDRRVPEGKNCLKYLEGRDVSRYVIDWSGSYLLYGPWLAQPRELGMFTRPRILIREITSSLPYSIHAALTTSTYLNNKSVLNVLDEDDNIARLKILCAILNSRLMSKLYMAFAVKAARRIFPKIVINNLREFAMPSAFKVDFHVSSAGQRIVALFDEVSRLTAEVTNAKNPETRARANVSLGSAETRMEKAICDLYGLSQEDARAALSS